MKTLIATIFVGIIYLITPENSFILLKFGKVLYLIFVFSSVFIGCVCIEKIIKQCKIYVDDYNIKKQEEEEKLEELWDFFDGIPKEEFEIVEKLINNENKPILIYNSSFDYEFYLANSIFNNDILIMSNQKVDNEEIEKFYIGDAKSINCEYLPHKVCKFKEDIFILLKKYKKKYNRISNFR